MSTANQTGSFPLIETGISSRSLIRLPWITIVGVFGSMLGRGRRCRLSARATVRASSGQGRNGLNSGGTATGSHSSKAARRRPASWENGVLAVPEPVNKASHLSIAPNPSSASFTISTSYHSLDWRSFSSESPGHKGAALSPDLRSPIRMAMAPSGSYSTSSRNGKPLVASGVNVIRMATVRW